MPFGGHAVLGSRNASKCKGNIQLINGTMTTEQSVPHPLPFGKSL